MITIGNNDIREVHGISIEERQKIKAFLQGAIYCWCKNMKDEWFSLRDLMGGDNFYWETTPLEVLYTKHINLKKINSDAVSDAGKDGGWLLKSVIHEDIRNFETKKRRFDKKI